MRMLCFKIYLPSLLIKSEIVKEVFDWNTYKQTESSWNNKEFTALYEHGTAEGAVRTTDMTSVNVNMTYVIG